MIKCFYDLHIHSALSPCASLDMTPNNIVNMAILKGLDFIAITDHNSGKNVRACIEVASNSDIIVVPGMEVETREGIHMLCYFPTLKALEDFNQIIDANLPDMGNIPWGSQLILDKDDNIIGHESKFLGISTLIPLNRLVDLVHEFTGLIFASHIDRYANSINTILGFIPEDLHLNGVEKCFNNNGVEKYPVIHNSDAHFLGDICERIHNIALPEKSISALFRYFGG